MALLDGIKVLDLSQIMAGPYCTMVLGDLGADIIKIEKINGGDDSRQMGPFYDKESACFIQINRNKRSVALNLKDEAGLRIFNQLATEADIVVENFRPGVAEKLGVGYDAVRAINERIIYCSISGYGQTGPYRDKGGFDLVMQGLSGMMKLTGEPDRRPLKAGIAIYDIGAGLTAIYSILAAFIQRERTGKGQYIDVALAECGIPWDIWEAAAYFKDGTEPEPAGWRHRVSAPYQVLRAKDDYMVIGAANQRNWERFCTDVMDHPEWIEDPRYLTNSERQKNVEALEAQIEAVLASETAQYWLDRCDRAGVPAGPVNTFSQALKDPHYQAREMINTFQHPVAGEVKTLGFASKFPQNPLTIRRASPLLGQHTAEVLQDLGYTEEALSSLRDRGVVR